jgi:hypothetical protein
MYTINSILGTITLDNDVFTIPFTIQVLLDTSIVYSKDIVLQRNTNEVSLSLMLQEIKLVFNAAWNEFVSENITQLAGVINSNISTLNSQLETIINEN